MTIINLSQVIANEGLDTRWSNLYKIAGIATSHRDLDSIYPPSDRYLRALADPRNGRRNLRPISKQQTLGLIVPGTHLYSD